MSFQTIIHAAVENNKHVPHITVTGSKVHVQCGEKELHPTSDKHYIGEIKIYGLKGAVLIELGSAHFYPGLTEPVAEFSVFEIASYSKIVATSYCNLHGIFHAEKELK
ncbi:Superoxide reductase [Spironucleus salmonicida]|uniref:Superoxide reductase n=1 Tax=Spironucleus salmonicida TaxID=348837 RepID=V6LNK5_9EUKA|nr:Superoxide reductase [Spironucleus salmonicida]KAH0575192.1 Superoxide reductase [Spironucleus salmonicida]|eukprot:EST42319.1 hypothetical protein SS50377_18190 [Spironucleus salmonicida]